MRVYTEQDYLRAGAEKKKRLIGAFCVLGLAFLALILGSIIRSEIVATYVAALIACLFYAVLELWAMPWVRYDRYLTDIKQGLSRETDARFVSISEKPRLNSGVLFYDFVVRVDVDTEGKDEDERLFYYDADKAPPSYAEGDHLHIVSFGNFITEIRAQ